MIGTPQSSGCTDRKEFAIKTLAQNYPFTKAGIVSNCCPQCYKGGVAFHEIYKTRSLIPKEEQATDSWTKLISEGKADPTQVLCALTPATEDNQAHILTNMKIVSMDKLGPNCGGVNCEPTCILCFSSLSGPVLVPEIWTKLNISVHAKCCAPCTSPGCGIMVPRLPVYHTRDEILQRCTLHTEKGAKARGTAWSAPRQLLAPPLRLITSLPKAVNTVSFKPPNNKQPRPSRLQAMNMKNPIKGLASLHRMLADNPLELTPQAPEPFVRRTQLRSRFDFTPPPPTRFDIPEPTDIPMEMLNISDVPSADSLLLKHFP